MDKVVDPIVKTTPILEKIITTQQGKPPEVVPEKVLETKVTPGEIQKADSRPEESKDNEINTEPKVTVEDYAAKIAALSKKDAYLLKKERELKEKEAKLTPLEKARQEKSVLKTFESMGLTFEEAMNRAITEMGGQAKEPDVKEQVKALEQRLLAKEKAEEEQKVQATEAQKQQAFDNFVKKTTEEVKAKGEEFELTNKYESYNLVIDVINEYFNKTGEMLASDKAAAEVEKYLEGQVELYLTTKKYQTKYPTTSVPKKESPTLSNNMTPSSSVPRGTMSKEERLKHAASLLKWK